MSIKSDFKKQKSKNKNLSDFINFTNVIKGKKYSMIKLSKNFNELVDKNDYRKEEVEMIYQELFRITNLS